MSKYLKNWNPRAVEAAVSGKLIERMDEVGQFVTEQAQSRVSVRTGKLRENITYEVDARENHVEVRVGARKPYFWAWFLEMGTRKMRARPWLRPAVWQNRATILRILAGSGASTARAPSRSGSASVLGAMKRGTAVARKVAGRFGMRVPSLPSLPRARLPSLPKSPTVRGTLRKLGRWF